MNNQRGGIISNLVLVPVALALMAGIFLLGYYVGRYQTKQATPGENLPPLPDVVSKNLPKPEDFTFYKTLTEKGNKTVSIELKAKENGDPKSLGKSSPSTASSGVQPPATEKGPEERTVKKSSQPQLAKLNAVKLQPPQEKKAAAPKPAASKLRYTIQYSSHQDRSTAEQEVRNMKQNGFAAFIMASDLPGKGTWYRVRVGSFTNKGSAEKLQKELRTKLGGEPIVTLE